MKKAIAIVSVFALLTLIPMTALAHRHCAPKTKVCSVKNCQKTSTHKHGKTSYKGHFFGDGHKHHSLCTKRNCRKTGSHKHGSRTYMPHH